MKSIDASLSPGTTGLLGQLGDDVTVLLLTYLTARELVFVSLANKSVFNKDRVQRAIRNIVSAAPKLRIRPAFKAYHASALSAVSPTGLYALECLSIISAVELTATDSAFWFPRELLVSTRTLTKKLNLPTLFVDESPRPRKAIAPPFLKKRSPGSPVTSLCHFDALMESSPSLTCAHGGLALESAVGRSQISASSWQLLRRAFPSLQEYSMHESVECIVCSEQRRDAEHSAQQRVAELMSARTAQWYCSELDSLLQRKSGLPHKHTVQHWLTETGLSSAETVLPSRCPLLPGSYQLLSASWLKKWRRFLRNASQSSPGPVDCSDLLCHAHGLLIVPPHLTEYLMGLRSSLTAGLSPEYTGLLVEVLSEEEWAHIGQIVPQGTDFHVQFDVSMTGSLNWNVELCYLCDPCNYAAPVTESGTRSAFRATRSRRLLL